MNRNEEQMLVELAAAGDRSAADRLIRAHQASLFAYMLRISGRPDVAEDIVQDAFVRVLTNLDRFDSRFRFSTWLFTIARRLYVNACQKHKPVYDSEVVGASRGNFDEPDAPTIEYETTGHARDAIGAALLQLTSEQREIIVLFHQQDWPISLIADFLKMPEGTVKSHLHRGRRRMRKYFEENQVVGIDLTQYASEADA